MDLGLSDDQEQLVGAFTMVCERAIGPDRVRDAEAAGIDPGLWQAMVELGAPGMGAPEAVGGGGASLMDLVLAAEVLGRALAPVPFVDHAVAVRLLADHIDPDDDTLAAVVAGDRIAAVAPIAAADGRAVMVPAGGVAHVVVALDESDLVLVEQVPPGPARPALGGVAAATVDLRAGDRRVLASGDAAAEGHARLVAEWRTGTAAALVGAGAGALVLGVEYAKARHQFGQPIGSFQAIAHPLADAATALDGARLLTREAAWAASEEPALRDALAAMAFAFAADTAQRSAAVALHTHGGYGFMLEYDVQLHYTRAKAWALLGGDPRHAVADVGDALFGAVGAGTGGR